MTRQRQSAGRVGMCGGESSHFYTTLVNYGVTEVDWTLKHLAFKMETTHLFRTRNPMALWRQGGSH